MKTTYLDNAATTMVDPEVVEEMNIFHSKAYGNASSLHHKGQEAKTALEKARETIAKAINASPEEIIFTSGGTESNNIAIQEVAYPNKNKGNHIITTKIEHDCILNACRFLEKDGFKITYLDVDKEGFIDPKELEKSITKDTILVSIIHGNNEIGTIQDLKAIGDICKKNNILFHTDACQSFTKTELDVQKQNLDLVTLNAHKIHGPKGIGALYVRKGTTLHPLIHGGGQEKGLRSGTENIPAIVGFGKAVDLAVSKKDIENMKELRDHLIKELLKIPDTTLNGPKQRLCNNVNISFRKVEGESIVVALDQKGICTSTGSACSSKSLDPSHVIMAISDDAERAHGSIRFSLSKYTTKEDIDFTIDETKKIIKKLRGISPLA